MAMIILVKVDIAGIKTADRKWSTGHLGLRSHEYIILRNRQLKCFKQHLDWGLQLYSDLYC